MTDKVQWETKRSILEALGIDHETRNLETVTIELSTNEPITVLIQELIYRGGELDLDFSTYELVPLDPITGKPTIESDINEE